ncbi:MAG: hypothetical protein A3G93_15680 [Nitrospinae bacterium RIFCSPLOWO2_12_FULL_45_22]|nr:MAG: hypothetical protein A3G93_15680 [Nitrospinae bacterium RIFCSPLOWO2_12_FULL_45_22]
MKGKISIYRLLVTGFSLLLTLAIPFAGSRAELPLEVQILPREVTTQPFEFSITVKVQPDINSLFSFNLLLNDQDITFALIVPALRLPESRIATFPDANTLKIVVPGVSLPNGTHKVEVKVGNSTGETASDSVTYIIGEQPPTQPSSISFSTDVKPIFDSRCAITGCHAGPNPQQGMNLSTPFDTTVGAVGVPSRELPSMLRINPGNPDNSYLVHKIQGTQEQAGGFGARMPFGGPFLTNEQIQTIREWISQGAKNN